VALEAGFVLGEREQVGEIIAEILARQPGLRPPYLEAQALRFRARLESSEAGFVATAAAFRALGMPFWTAVVQLEHAELVGGQGRTSEADPLLAEARATFERLGATPWL